MLLRVSLTTFVFRATLRTGALARLATARLLGAVLAFLLTSSSSSSSVSASEAAVERVRLRVKRGGVGWSSETFVMGVPDGPRLKSGDSVRVAGVAGVERADARVALAMRGSFGGFVASSQKSRARLPF